MAMYGQRASELVQELARCDKDRILRHNVRSFGFGKCKFLTLQHRDDTSVYDKVFPSIGVED